ncbi:hypothetical protein CF326_g4649 [Tilletia indica]|uniref:Uncharacterized protein n=1 Tax=Tilletia indica TaxID=43049 RepID=A0A177TLN9_9BASI|nr:hypothetical protein CF326_g4649 [Tilletia indica]KAE8251803.1 hypothetical protein A4X13_0g3842 [Tilletia indica]
MPGHLSSLDLAVAWFNQFALHYAILGDAFTGILVVAFVLMTLCSNGQVFKRARYAIITLATLAQISASVLNSIDARRLGLHENIPDTLFTAQVAMLFVVPLFADFALIPRIKELTRQRGVALLSDKRTLLAVGLPLALKIPRIILVVDFLSMTDTCVPLTKTSPLASVLMCMPAQKFAKLQWTVQLADQSISMITLAICMYHLGWGWGDKRAVSKSILGKASMFGCTLAATMVLPVIVLGALLALHASGKKTHIEGYLIALQPNVSVLGVALAALYPIVRADRRLQLARSRMQVSQTEARRLSLTQYEAAEPFTLRNQPGKTLLGAPHLRPGGIPHLKRHSSHSGYLNSTTFSEEKVNGEGGMGSPQGHWTITTRQRSPHSESEDGLDEKIGTGSDHTHSTHTTPSHSRSNSYHLKGSAPSSPAGAISNYMPTTPTRMQSHQSWNGVNQNQGGSPYSPASRGGTPMSQMEPTMMRGSPLYRS